jgi:hypothetical protein
MGSGSTLLRLMLDSHGNLAIPEETGFMRLVSANRWVPRWRQGGRWYRRLGLSRADLDAELAAFYGSLFTRYAAARGKRRWGDKTPLHTWHMKDMAALFPDAQFVGIVRHPGGTTVSLTTRFRRRFDRAVTHWLRLNNQLVREGARLGERFVLLRYEDLVAQPREVMTELLAWLGEPWSDDVLRHHEVQVRAGSRRTSDGLTRPGDPIDPERASRWASALSDEERTELTTRTAAWAAFFGYDVAAPQHLEQLDGTRRTLLDGVELRARRRRLRGTVDLAPPPRPKREGPYRPRPRGARPLTQDTVPDWAAEPARVLLDRLPQRAQRALRRARDRAVGDRPAR